MRSGKVESRKEEAICFVQHSSSSSPSSLGVAAAASALLLPPSPLPALDPLTCCCLLLFLWEPFLEVGGGRKSSPPSLPRTPSEASAGGTSGVNFRGSGRGSEGRQHPKLGESRDQGKRPHMLLVFISTSDWTRRLVPAQ